MLQLSAEDLSAFRSEIEALQESTTADLGQRDIQYIHSMVALSRALEVGGRLLIHASLDPLTWSAGVALLASHLVLDSMEIGHNILHGQYDWTQDPRFSSKNFNWNFPVDETQWQQEHNEVHHLFTNIVGKDPDLGFERFRLTDKTEWSPSHLGQPALIAASFLAFDHSIGHYVASTGTGKDVGIGRFLKKAASLAARDYVLYPLLGGVLAPKIFLGNLIASIFRNVFAAAVIFCGHFPDGVETFSEEDVERDGAETFLLRQVLGSSNFEGGRLLSIMAGHLNHQIEHHLFPRVPAWRYRELAPRVRAICKKYGIAYNTGSFTEQFGSVVRKIFRLSLPPASKSE